MAVNMNLVSRLLHPDFTALKKLGDVEMSVKVNNMVKMAFIKTEEANTKRELLMTQLRDLADQLSRIEANTQVAEEKIRELEEKERKSANDKATIAALKRAQKKRAETAAEVRARAAELETTVSAAVAVANRYADDFNTYMEEQKMLFKSKGLGENRAYKDMMLPNGELKKADGTVLQLFKIVKRDVDLEPVEADDNINGHALSVAAARSYSDTVGIAKDQTRGKYNDGHMLINGEAANIDRSEYANWVAM